MNCSNCYSKRPKPVVPPRRGLVAKSVQPPAQKDIEVSNKVTPEISQLNMISDQLAAAKMRIAQKRIVLEEVCLKVVLLLNVRFMSFRITLFQLRFHLSSIKVVFRNRLRVVRGMLS